jgi:hypothetical protein
LKIKKPDELKIDRIDRYERPDYEGFKRRMLQEIADVPFIRSCYSPFGAQQIGNNASQIQGNNQIEKSFWKNSDALSCS